jgi:hypothetical protein
MIKTKMDPEWKSTVGARRSEKLSKSLKETLNNPEWKSTVGEHKRIRSSVVQNDPEWKASKYKTCEHCGKGPMHPSNYVRHHGNNCKHTQHTKEHPDMKETLSHIPYHGEDLPAKEDKEGKK